MDETISELHKVSVPNCTEIKCRICHMRARGCKGLGQPCPKKGELGYKIQSPADWWALVDAKNVSLRGLVFNYIDPAAYAGEVNGVMGWYPFLNAAAWLVARFDQAIVDRNYEVFRRMIGIAWMAAPSDRPDNGYGRDWDALCDLCSDDRVFDNLLEENNVL